MSSHQNGDAGNVAVQHHVAVLTETMPQERQVPLTKLSCCLKLLRALLPEEDLPTGLRQLWCWAWLTSRLHKGQKECKGLD